MVLSGKTDDRGGLRFLFGAAVIAASIYAFYIGIARINSPELFLVPEAIDPRTQPCSVVSSGTLAACIPQGMDTALHDGRIEFSSARDRIRGSLEVVPGLPDEAQWRTSLEKPLLRVFLGDVRGMGTFELMDRILRHRYNPSTMGAKAVLIPHWMKRDPQARIFSVRHASALLFHTPGQCLGLSFQEGRIVVLSVTGRIPAGTAAGILAGTRPATPAGPRTE